MHPNAKQPKKPKPRPTNGPKFLREMILKTKG